MTYIVQEKLKNAKFFERGLITAAHRRDRKSLYVKEIL